jgi:gas vesicle protein
MSEKDGGNGFLLGFILGALAGVAVGFLYAPKSGKETRAILKEKADEFKDRASEFINRAKEMGKG